MRYISIQKTIIGLIYKWIEVLPFLAVMTDAGIGCSGEGPVMLPDSLWGDEKHQQTLLG